METMKATFEADKCGGASSARHNDRSFDTDRADNIDSIEHDRVWFRPDNAPTIRVPLQQYDRGLAQYEQDYYRERFGAAIEAQKERHIKSRHRDRAEGCTAERYYNSKQTCPTSLILQVGKDGEYQDRKKFLQMLNAAIRDLEQDTEDARVKVLSVSLHAGETSLHAHFRVSFEVKGPDGWVQDQEKCLAKLGYKLPEPSKKKGRHNNRKMVWTAEMRQKWYDTVERIDPSIHIDRTPDPNNPKTRGKASKAVGDAEKALAALHAEMAGLNRQIAAKRKEAEEVANAVYKPHEEALERLYGLFDRLTPKQQAVEKSHVLEAVRRSKIVFGQGAYGKATTEVRKEADRLEERYFGEIEEPEDWERD